MRLDVLPGEVPLTVAFALVETTSKLITVEGARGFSGVDAMDLLNGFLSFGGSKLCLTLSEGISALTAAKIA